MCALSGRLFVGDLHDLKVREIDTVGPVFDPRPSPNGERVAYVCGRSIRVVGVAADNETNSCFELAGPEKFDELDTVGWGSAEFVAA
ncbi:MAG: S9 family peptidase, partial [Actinobacteria bacterium]|nr:S9 family peptidase [Actinomycetota bacterium]